MKIVQMPSIRDFRRIGCKVGQAVITQIVESDGIMRMHVYDARTEKLIGKIEL